MKKLQVNGLQPLTKEQMKSISGGMYCNIDDECPTTYQCIDNACKATVFCSDAVWITFPCADCFFLSNPCGSSVNCYVVQPPSC